MYIHAVKQISAAPWLPLEHREYELLVANCSLVATELIYNTYPNMKHTRKHHDLVNNLHLFESLWELFNIRDTFMI